MTTTPHPGCKRWSTCHYAKTVKTDRGFPVQRCELTAAHPSACVSAYLETHRFRIAEPTAFFKLSGEPFMFLPVEEGA